MSKRNKEQVKFSPINHSPSNSDVSPPSHSKLIKLRSPDSHKNPNNNETRGSDPSISSVSSPSESVSSSDATHTRKEEIDKIRAKMRESIIKLTENLMHPVQSDSPERSNDPPVIIKGNYTKHSIEEQKEGVSKPTEKARKTFKSDKYDQSHCENAVQSGSKVENKVSQNIGNENKDIISSSFLTSQSEHNVSRIKPVKLRFSDDQKVEDNQLEDIIKTDKTIPKKSNVAVKDNRVRCEKEEKNKRKSVGRLQEEFYIKLESEELILTQDQRILDNLFQISFKKPKGNREFFIKRDLAFLKNIKAIYKDVQIDEDKREEDLDVCPQYGEKVFVNTDGIRFWHQLDINAMKLEKRKLLKNNAKPREHSITMEVNGKKCYIGEREFSTREPMESIDDGKVSVLYHGEYFNLHVFCIEIRKAGKFVHKVNDEVVTVKINRASKHSSIMFDEVPVQNVESDMLLFVPKRSSLIIQNNSKVVTSIIKAEISIYRP